MSGNLLPGNALVERELCSKYNISRTPMREILWKLASDGLLDQERSKGYTVKKISLELFLVQTVNSVEMCQIG